MIKSLPVLLALTGMLYSLQLQAQNCCDDPACHDKAKQFAADIGRAVDFLGPYPPDQPVDFKGKKHFLDSLKVYKPAKYVAIKLAAKHINDWSSKDVSRRVCLSREYQTLSEDQQFWANYFITDLYSSRFRSPEFRKGAGLLLHSGIGASSPFKSTELFASLTGLLLSYTFTPKGQTTGGRIRVLLGPGLYYSATNIYWLVHPRVEFRLVDLGNELTNIGCLKLIAQGGFQKDIQLAGLGVAAEISRFHIQLTGNYIFDPSAFVLQTGLGYSFAFNKK